MWTIKIVAEGETEQEASGETPTKAFLNLMAEIFDLAKRGEATIDGDFISSMGDILIEIELHHDDEEAVSTFACGDFSQPWQLVLTRDTCDDSGIVYGTPVGDDHEYEDDCERV